MKNQNPLKCSQLSMIIIGAGCFLLLFGAFIAQNHKINAWIIAGAAVILLGMIYYLIRVRCPHCGHSLAGYRPLPKECPNCHKKF